MKKINWCAIAIAVGVLMVLFTDNSAFTEQEPITKLFDTSIIETQWGGDFENGTVRMVGAWWYADGMVEDEMGQLWGIEQNINTDDFLLLWITDNHTPNDMTDDIVIKVWREAY